jgi:serine protease
MLDITDGEPRGGWYQPRGLTNPPDAVPPVVLARTTEVGDDPTDLLRRLNHQLEEAGSQWRLEREEDSRPLTVPVVTPFLLKWQPGARPEPVPEPADLLPFLRGRGVDNASLDPFVFGAPAYKPNALTSGDFGRVPVHVLARQPRSRQGTGGRRPVVALLDTGIGDHPWLGPPDPRLGGDGFWVDARELGWNPGPRAPGRGSDRPGGGPGGQLGAQEGHGTFSAGLIRQVAPDAQVLLMRLIHDDGTIYADHLLNALGWLHEQVAGEHPLPMDVVCLPMDFTPVLPGDAKVLSWLGTVLGALGHLGVLVVAAAGNDGRDHPTYPAAFASADAPPETPLISVGALNPNGTSRAYYSNFGDWVTDWAVGTSVVSCFPAVDGGANPELGPVDREQPPGESVDPDDFTGGFARWSGTSFAAAVIAGRLADALAQQPIRADGPPVDAVEERRHRAAAARKSVPGAA